MGHLVVSFDPPSVFDSKQVTFCEGRSQFKEYDWDALQLKYHNRVPSSILPGIERPSSAKKKSEETSNQELELARDLFDMPRETDMLGKSKNRSSSIREEVFSQPKKRTKTKSGSRGSKAVNSTVTGRKVTKSKISATSKEITQSVPCETGNDYPTPDG